MPPSAAVTAAASGKPLSSSSSNNSNNNNKTAKPKKRTRAKKAATTSGKAPTFTPSRRERAAQKKATGRKPRPAPPDPFPVDALVSTQEWLGANGLAATRLMLENWLPAIGFRKSDAFVLELNQYVEAEYSKDLFEKFPLPDGSVYNVTLDDAKCATYISRLEVAIDQFRARLAWLTTGSRRAFGRVNSSKVAFVLHFTGVTEERVEAYRSAVRRLIEDQLCKIEAFNLMACGAYVTNRFGDQASPSAASVAAAKAWTTSLGENNETEGDLDVLDAMHYALEDASLDEIFLVTDSRVVTQQEILLQKAKASARPVHCVALNLDDEPTTRFFKRVARETGGRFHAFNGDLFDVDDEGLSSKCESEEVMLLRNEIGRTSATLATIKALVAEDAAKKSARSTKSSDATHVGGGGGAAAAAANKGSNNSSSTAAEPVDAATWLKTNSVEALKLTYHDALEPSVFRHAEGDVGILVPEDGTSQYDDFFGEVVPPAVEESRHMHAEMCKDLTLMRWRDGSMVHIFVSESLRRNYKRRVDALIKRYLAKLRQYQRGSWELFGQLSATAVAFVVDLSDSMGPKMDDLRRRLKTVLKEQVLNKRHFNLISFGTEVTAWKETAVEANAANIREANSWIDTLKEAGTTNTLAALKRAFSDETVGALYVLSDGRPDQDEGEVVAAVQAQQESRAVPVNTVSFNCADIEANQMLSDLAELTGGSFQYFTGGLQDVLLDPAAMKQLGPPPHGGYEDCELIRAEIRAAKQHLRQVNELRAECARHEEVRAQGLGPEAMEFNLTIKPNLPATKSGVAGTVNQGSDDGFRRPQLPSETTFISKLVKSHKGLVPVQVVDNFQPTAEKPAWDSGGPSTPARPQPASSTRGVGEESSSKPPKIKGRQVSTLQPPAAEPSSDAPGEGSTRVKLGDITQIDPPSPVVGMADAALGARNASAITAKIGIKDEEEEGGRESAWLAAHSINAQKLTIFDVLAPTSVKHASSYIPIIGKTVHARALADAFSYYQIETNTGETLHVNPTAAHLDDYEERLGALVTLFRERRRLLIMRDAAVEQREELESTPSTLLEAKLEVYTAQHGSEHHRALTLEIERGEDFLRQSRAMREEMHIRAEESDVARRARASMSKSKRPAWGAGGGGTTKPRAVDALGLSLPMTSVSRKTTGLTKKMRKEGSNKTGTDNNNKKKKKKKKTKKKKQQQKKYAVPDDGPMSRNVLTIGARHDAQFPGDRRRTFGLTLAAVAAPTKIDTDGDWVPLLDFEPGDRVLARWPDDGFFYPSFVHSAISIPDVAAEPAVKVSQNSEEEENTDAMAKSDTVDGDGRNTSSSSPAAAAATAAVPTAPALILPTHYLVTFGGDPVPVPRDHIIFAGDMPPLRRGDCVLAPGAVQGSYLAHIPGRVSEVHEGMYGVLLANADDIAYQRPEVVRVSLGQYNTICALLRTDTEAAATAESAAAMAPLGYNDGRNGESLPPVAPEDALMAIVERLQLGGSTGAPIERTCAIVLPEGVRSGFDTVLFDQIERAGLRVLVAKDTLLSPRRAREFYWEFRNRPEYEDMVAALSDGPSYVAVISGPGALQLWAAMICQPLASAGVGPSRFSDMVHGSVSALHAERDISFFFDPRTRDYTTTVCVKDHEEDAAFEASLEHLLGSTVLARWPSDGWWYPAVLREYMGGGVFVVEDEDLTTDTVAQDEFVLLGECHAPEERGDRVLCEHPLYENSFCPGTLGADRWGRPVVVLYDATAVLLSQATVFGLPQPQEYASMVALIDAAEAAWVRRTVVCRYDEDGLFYEGVVNERERGRCFRVGLLDGHIIEAQDCAHMMSHEAQGEAHHVLKRDDCVIALYYAGQDGDAYEHNIFGPATVTGVTYAAAGIVKVEVEFWQGKRDILTRAQCFWVATEYHDAACAYIRARKDKP